MKHSISKSVLARFASGQATPQERRAVAVHLLQGCPVCAKTLRTVVWPESSVRARAPARNEPASPLVRMKRGADETEPRSPSLQG